jgi:hypothetical protein
VAAALVVAVDVTPEDPIVGAFASFVPDDGATAAAWNAVIAPAAGAALSRYQPALRVHQKLEVVFHYVDLADLVHRLEEDA